ncbi:phage tail tape measure C-terminal domain-containing protein [Pelagibacterium montanilacus]|uniref:phage tail tape measure C-terminal domain-containing protein n=1 Tax=Pelagibacterium montanilacus TaxID=2185280 RepID=UPI000F8DF196|nr:phage tail tape measure C-terminal domain-containing protein [Pelagibacterium montanilacus]
MSNNRKNVGIRLSVEDREIAVRALQQFGREGKGALESIEKAGRPASDALRAVNSGAGAAQDGLRQLSGEAGGLGRLLSRGGLLGLGLAGLVGGLAMATRHVVQLANELGELNADATRAGLGVEAYQELGWAAQNLNTDQQSVAQGFRDMTVQASAFARDGAGSAADAFRRLGFSQVEVREGLRDTDQLFTDIIARMEGLAASDRIDIARTIFGDSGGEAFLTWIEAGTDRISALRREAQELGLVIGQDVFDRAQEVEDKFKTLSQVIDVQLKTAFMDLAPVVLGIAELLATVARTAAELIDGFKAVDQLSERGLASRGDQIRANMAEIQAEIADLERVPARLRGGTPENDPLQARRDQLQAMQDQLSEIDQQVLQRAVNRKAEQMAMGAGGPGPELLPPGTGAEIDQLARQAEQLIARLRSAGEEYAATMESLNAMLGRGLIDQETYNRAVGEVVIKRAEASATEAEYAEALDLVNDARERGILSEQEYTRTIEDLTRRRLEAQNDWAAGFQLGMMNLAGRNRDFANDVASAWTDAFSSAEDAIVSLVQTGEADFKSLVDSILADLLRLSIRQGITGPLSGMLSGLMGGGGAMIGGQSVAYTPGLGYTPVAHAGWMVGRGNPPGMRPAQTAGLDRFHIGGLNRGERMVVAQDGEGIFTPRQMDNADAMFRSMMAVVEKLASPVRAGQGGAAPRIEIHNHSGQPVRTETGRDGQGMDFTRIIVGTVAGAIGEGRLDTVMGQTYGLRRQGV